jgi:hypothetical protein
MSPFLLTSSGVRTANVAPSNDLPTTAPDYECRITPSRTTTSLYGHHPDRPRTPPKAPRNASVLAHVTFSLEGISIMADSPAPRFARITSAVLLRALVSKAKSQGKQFVILEADRATAIADELERIDAERVA